MAAPEQLRRLEIAVDDIANRQRSFGERIAALEDRTAGQRMRISALEVGFGQVNLTIGRIEDRGVDRGERLAALEQAVRDSKPSATPSHPLAAVMTDLRVLLIGAILIGMALGKAGIDPTAWFR